MGKFFYLLVACCSLLFSVATAAEAKAQLQVNWVPQIFYVESGQDRLFDSSTERELAAAITQKLKSLEAGGKLPFKINYRNEMELHNLRENFGSGDIPIGLIPIVTLDESFVVSHSVGSDTYYKAVVASGLTLAICSASEMGDDNWRILAAVPLNSYTTIGEDMKQRTPITLPMERQMYTDCTAKAVRELLDFKPIRKALADWETKQLIADTYQITDVAISSQKAQEIFRGHEKSVKNILAGFYGAEFQKATGHVVLPPKTLDEGVRRRVSNTLNAWELHSDAGTIYLEYPQADHNIKLNLYGVASNEIERSDPSTVRRDVAYKVWLQEEKDSRIRTDTAYRTEFFLKAPNSVSNVDEKDIYTKLLIDIARKMGRGKK